MNNNGWGGAREGAGRPAVGKTSKCITLTLTIEQAELLKNRAEAEGLTVSQYIVKECGLPIKNKNVKYMTEQSDSWQKIMAAENISAYNKD